MKNPNDRETYSSTCKNHPKLPPPLPPPGKPTASVLVNKLPKHSLANCILQAGPRSDAGGLAGSLGRRIPNTLPGDMDAAGAKPVASEGPLSYQTQSSAWHLSYSIATDGMNTQKSEVPGQMHREISHYSEPCLCHRLRCDLFSYWSLQICTIPLDGYQ